MLSFITILRFLRHQMIMKSGIYAYCSCRGLFLPFSRTSPSLCSQPASGWTVFLGYEESSKPPASCLHSGRASQWFQIGLQPLSKPEVGHTEQAFYIRAPCCHWWVLMKCLWVGWSQSLPIRNYFLWLLRLLCGDISGARGMFCFALIMMQWPTCWTPTLWRPCVLCDCYATFCSLLPAIASLFQPNMFLVSTTNLLMLSLIFVGRNSICWPQMLSPRWLQFLVSY